jgi:hypothetical protein
MTQERKHAILLAAVILTARKLQPLLDEMEREGKAITFWSEVYIKNAIERAADILDKIDEKWPFGYANVFFARNVAFFHGASLPDLDGLLQGTGKLMRHVKLRPETATNAAALRRLIDMAY